ncbi:MAG: SprT family zinc-dependent metalloprotease [Synechococcales bacterium]|nr:SprT family zinc-dependent metalloprotease [Synechococcales bacterium]
MPIAYQVRESNRAKRVNIRYSLKQGLEIVVPIGFDQREIPAIAAKYQTWAARTRDKLLQKEQAIPQQNRTLHLPNQIEFQAIAETWQVEYTPANVKHIKIQQIPDCIILWGNTPNEVLCRKALKSWLIGRAESFLTPWLQALSQDCHLPFNQITVRGQKTLWGSCSTDKNISLNYKLLFLPPQLVRYVLIHELCHTIHMNHSTAFWQLVQQHDAFYKRWDRELNQASRYVPKWLDT